jgi:peptide deformylase
MRTIETIASPHTEAFAHMPLLQSDNLTKAAEIDDPQHLERDQLLPILAMGYALCEANPTIAAVAYTQFPPNLFAILGADDMLARIIYFSHFHHKNVRLHGEAPIAVGGSLFINPRLIDQSNRFIVWNEGCGSIWKTRLHMFVARPISVTLRGYVWNHWIQRPIYFQEKITRTLTGYMEHEMDHLDGRDATDRPEQILDFNDIPSGLNGRPVEKIANATVRFVLDYWCKKGVSHFLVHRQGKLLVVDTNGDAIGPYTRRQEDFRPI